MRLIKILLVDYSAEFLKCAAGFLATDPRVKVVGRALNGMEAIRLARELKPDLVLMDVVMPLMSGLFATRLIKASAGCPRVVIVTMHEDE
jgi:two-component system nitrate/nitrite response regulator NarL